PFALTKIRGKRKKNIASTANHFYRTTSFTLILRVAPAKHCFYLVLLIMQYILCDVNQKIGRFSIFFGAFWARLRDGENSCTKLRGCRSCVRGADIDSGRETTTCWDLQGSAQSLGRLAGEVVVDVWALGRLLLSDGGLG
ncbi:MAG: hypothetical protein JW720_12300, partial [Sedimentisphaerales bacterium]|nr:hypothetical protein [Sedimentisphaerales bacterium]